MLATRQLSQAFGARRDQPSPPRSGMPEDRERSETPLNYMPDGRFGSTEQGRAGAAPPTARIRYMPS